MKCNDQSMKFLKGFGYNVIRLPRADIKPLQIGANYTFEPEKIYNLRADDYIWNHSDIKNPATAGALVSAFLS